MTSHELAKKLLAGPDLMVTRSGYEGGVKEVTNIDEPAPIRLHVNTEWYYGEHEYYSKYDKEPKPATLAIHIG